MAAPSHARLLALGSTLLLALACGGHTATPPPPASRADKVAGAAPAPSPRMPPSPASSSADQPTASSGPLCVAPWKPSRIALPALRHLGDLPQRAELAGHWSWITIWAAWCHPCKEELPLLVRWSQPLGFRLLPLSLDDDQRQLEGFLATPGRPISASYWFPESDERTRFLSGLGLPDPPTLPEQLLVDPKGIVRCLIAGAVAASDRPRIEALLHGP